ncbi:MAG: hypothetical protein WDA08_06145 [Weeksellaceae bacterium]
MKTIILTISIILSSALYISCNNNDDEPTPIPIEENGISGKWALAYRNTYGMGEAEYQAEYGDLFLEFNLENNKVKIISSLDMTVPENIQLTGHFRQAGEYDFALEEDIELYEGFFYENIVKLNLPYLYQGNDYWFEFPYWVQGDTLKIGESDYPPQADDGGSVWYRFVKVD